MASFNSTGDDVFAFVQHLSGHLKRSLLLIWDRFSGHKKAARLLRDLYGTRIHVEFLPEYAPVLNVVEQCWGYTKYGEMANFIPQDIDEAQKSLTRCWPNTGAPTCSWPSFSMPSFASEQFY
jgi:transposase